MIYRNDGGERERERRGTVQYGVGLILFYRTYSTPDTWKKKKKKEAASRMHRHSITINHSVYL